MIVNRACPRGGPVMTPGGSVVVSCRRLGRLPRAWCMPVSSCMMSAC